MYLRWMKCQRGEWCVLFRLDLSTVTGFGVYVIWAGGAVPYTVYVGTRRCRGPTPPPSR